MRSRQPSHVIKCKEYDWETVDRHRYKTEGSGFKSVHRCSLLTGDYPELNFHTRYFEIQPGGYSSLEHHRHTHTVVIIRGRGSVILDNEIHSLGLHDVIYIPPWTIHQFHAGQNDPLGFLCTVDRYRDKPVVPGQASIEERIPDPEIRNKIRC